MAITTFQSPQIMCFVQQTEEKKKQKQRIYNYIKQSKFSCFRGWNQQISLLLICDCTSVKSAQLQCRIIQSIQSVDGCSDLQSLSSCSSLESARGVYCISKHSSWHIFILFIHQWRKKQKHESNTLEQRIMEFKDLHSWVFFRSDVAEKRFLHDMYYFCIQCYLMWMLIGKVSRQRFHVRHILVSVNA